VASRQILVVYTPIGKGRSWREILGMNARTLLVNWENSPQAMRFVGNKQKPKDALAEVGVSVSPHHRAGVKPPGTRGVGLG